MGLYDARQLLAAVEDALEDKGWKVEHDTNQVECLLSVSLTHPLLTANGEDSVIDLKVTDPSIPGDWILAARAGLWAFDNDEADRLFTAGAKSSAFRTAEDVTDIVSSAVIGRAHELDEAHRRVDVGGEPARRTVFDDHAYLDPEDFRDTIFDCLVSNDVDSWGTAADVPDDVLHRETALLRDVDLDDECRNVDDAVSGYPLVACGNLGLWDSTPKVGFVADDFRKLYELAMGRDCEYFKAWDENGRLFVSATHHDGTNCFEVRALNDRGVDWLGEVDAEAGVSFDDISLLMLDGYSEVPRVARKIYGCPEIEWDKTASLPTARAAMAAKAAEALVGNPETPRRSKTI